MGKSQRLNMTLTGGAPWGFRLAGGGALPLTINKIRKKSRAHFQGLLEGDAVISINGVPVHDKSQDEALDLVEKARFNLELEIFRGKMDELTKNKPKKTIKVPGAAPAADSGLTLSATVDDVTSSAQSPAPSAQTTTEASSELILTATVDDVSSSVNDVQPVVDTSSDLVLTASVDDVTSDTYQVDSGASSGLTLTATVDDMSGTTFTPAEDTSSGLILTASVDDMTSSTNQMVESSPMMSAVIGDVTATSSPAVEETQSFSAQSAVLAEPFMDVRASPSPARLSPVPPKLSPKPTSPRLSPAMPQHRTPSPQLAPPVSPKPVSPRLSPVAPAARTPSPQPPPPPVSPKPSTTSLTSRATFVDGDTRREVQRQEHYTQTQDGRGATRVQQQTTTTTTSTTTKRVPPPATKPQPAAFSAVPPQNAFTPVSQRSTFSTTSTLKSSTTSTLKQPAQPAALSSSTSSNYLQYQPPPQQVSVSTSRSTSNFGMGSMAPVFKPSKFVPGPSKKEVPGLYAPVSSSKSDVTSSALYSPGGGKENMAPIQPMFQVKNFVSEKSKSKGGRDIWRPNVWLSDQQPGHKQQQQQQPPQVLQYNQGKPDFSPYTTFPVSSVQAGVSLMEDPRRKYETQSSRVSDFGDGYYDEEDSVDQYGHHQSSHGRLHVFAPPVEIQAQDDGYEPYDQEGEPNYMDEYDGEPLSPESSLRRKKKIYADSAFYDTPGKSFPTIPEQMKLCKIIAQSLTSSANKRARGAKMFMRRKRKSNKWVHEGHSEWSSSAGDVANLRELDSELSPDEDGKALFYFKIPNLKNRVSGDAKQTKMALSQEQFEKLRLNSKKCDHRVVPPDTCFDIVADLKAHKGRGGRMFERRKQRSDKYVIGNENVQQRAPYHKLENVLSKPVRQEKTPWEAAMQGNVDAAFSHISEMERNQKLNQILKYSPPRKLQTTPLPPNVQSAPLPALGRISIKSDGASHLLRGKNFNRSAIGWHGGGEYPIADHAHHVSPTRQTAPAPSTASAPAFGDYNNKVRAWQGPGDSPYASPSQPAGQWDQRRADDRQARRYDDRSASQWAEPQYSAPPQEVPVRQELFQPRPKSWQSDGYDTTYRDEYEYNYVPVDTRYSSNDQPPLAYMQPIIPGTDL